MGSVGRTAFLEEAPLCGAEEGYMVAAETLEELAICGTEAGRKESSSLAPARIITLT